MYHLDREFAISEWTTNYSHIYVAYYEPELLQVNTLATLKEWKILKDADTSMEDVSTGNKDSDGWIDVPERGRHRGKSPPKKETEIATPTQTTELQMNGTKEQRHISDREKHSNIPARQAIKELHNQLKQSKRYQKHMKPASKLPQVSTVQEEDEDEFLMEEDHSKGSTTATWSDALPKLQPFHNVPVNDGTHRLTVKWKPSGGIQQ
ncbi:hypothetical protein MHU86_11282 [Fragilaria crotonensis]|nr:hypothetical protein MHU86_11282 [Fragilaria crotonensis]